MCSVNGLYHEERLFNELSAQYVGFSNSFHTTEPLHSGIIRQKYVATLWKWFHSPQKGHKKAAAATDTIVSISVSVMVRKFLYDFSKNTPVPTLFFAFGHVQNPSTSVPDASGF